METTIIIISTIVVLLIIWAMIVTHAHTLRYHVQLEWKRLHDLLLLRHDYLPNLIETVRSLTTGQDAVIAKVIEKRATAMHIDDVNSSKVVAELELVQAANEMMGLSKQFPELAKHTNFLELKSDLASVKTYIHQQTDRYNNMVRRYNKYVKNPLLAILCLPFGYRKEHVFTAGR